MQAETTHLLPALAILLLGAFPAGAQEGHGAGHGGEDPHAHHRAMLEQKATLREEEVPELTIPDVELLDQEGRSVHFYSDLVAGRVVAIHFVFTTCTTICPPMGASFARLQSLLGERAGRDVHLISVSVDPTVDTPERLRAWASKFTRGDGPGPGWTLVTGPKPDVDRLLKALAVFTPDKEDHSPILLLGNDAAGRWSRVYGLAPPAALAAGLEELAAAPPAAAPEAAPPEAAPSQAAQYFTDVELINQDGEPMRFYTDLLAGKAVVINTIFTTCTGICPVMSKTFSRFQEHLGERLGRDVHLISISVDPEHDTPERLKAFGARFGAKPGWYLLTGRPENVAFALGRLGQQTADPENHQALIFMGNEPTGLWKKTFGLAPAEDLVALLDSVLADEGSETPGR